MQQAHRNQLLAMTNSAFERCEAEDRAELAAMSDAMKLAKELFDAKTELAGLQRQLEESQGNHEHAVEKNDSTMKTLKREMYRTHDAMQEEGKY